MPPAAARERKAYAANLVSVDATTTKSTELLIVHGTAVSVKNCYVVSNTNPDTTEKDVILCIFIPKMTSCVLRKLPKNITHC